MRLKWYKFWVMDPTLVFHTVILNKFIEKKQ